MIEFCDKPHPHGIFNEDLPAALKERDRQHYRFDPACDVRPDYMALGYYYRRFGIDYERSFYVVRGLNRYIYFPQIPPDDTNWILMSDTKIFFMDREFRLKDQPIAITNNL
jgi:hypothetical protein